MSEPEPDRIWLVWCRIRRHIEPSFGGKTSQRIVSLILDDLPEDDMPLLLRDFHAERMADGPGYQRLMAFLARR